mgnify:CR=1 FL=1
MKKYEYLSELEKRLSALPADARRDALNYYEEYFDAAGPDNEDATAAELGDPAMSRQLLADPEWPNKVASGQIKEIHRCVRCNKKCLGGLQQHQGTHCIYEKV